MNATAIGATNAPERLLTTDEIADRLGVHPVTVRNWVRSGALASLRLGHRTRRVTEQDLASFLRERREGREGGDV
jgi:excisionase family DNA binding protein